MKKRATDGGSFLVARPVGCTYFIVNGGERVENPRDEIDEDYALLAGLAAKEDATKGVWESARSRLPWLCLLFWLGLVVSGVVGLFERVVEHLSLIVSFQSLILGMAGNTGTQSLAVTVRTLSDKSLNGTQKRALASHEARVGLCNGALLSFLSLIVVFGYLYVLRGEEMRLSLLVALCASLALFLSMFLASVSGAVIPLFLDRCGVDPAVASGPFITTLNDLVAVITYYGLAFLLLVRVIGI